ncbi:unnamed protein product [Symbiodinium sp. KB8]|nr:unnamed protein product [Symbiodinium sp. KB8]
MAHVMWPRQSRAARRQAAHLTHTECSVSTSEGPTSGPTSSSAYSSSASGVQHAAPGADAMLMQEANEDAISTAPTDYDVGDSISVLHGVAGKAVPLPEGERGTAGDVIKGAPVPTASPIGTAAADSSAGASGAPQDISGCVRPGQGVRWGLAPHPWAERNVPLLHYPAEDADSVHIRVVLTRRPRDPPDLPALNKWQGRRCALTGVKQTTGSVGFLSGEARAVYCNYLELLIAAPSFGSERRIVPWRLVHLGDDTPLPVCRQAAAYIDTIWHMPVLQLSRVAPKVMSRQEQLQRMRELRYRLVTLRKQMRALAVMAASTGHDQMMGESVISGGVGSALPADSSAAFAGAEGELPPAARDMLRLRLGEEHLYMADTPEMLALAHFKDACAGRFASMLASAVAAAESYVATRLAARSRRRDRDQDSTVTGTTGAR